MEYTDLERELLRKLGEDSPVGLLLGEVRGHAITPELYFQLCQEVDTLVGSELARQVDLVFLLPCVSQDKAIRKALSERKSKEAPGLQEKSEADSVDKSKRHTRPKSKFKPKSEPDSQSPSD